MYLCVYLIHPFPFDTDLVRHGPYIVFAGGSDLELLPCICVVYLVHSFPFDTGLVRLGGHINSFLGFSDKFCVNVMINVLCTQVCGLVVNEVVVRYLVLVGDVKVSGGISKLIFNID